MPRAVGLGEGIEYWPQARSSSGVGDLELRLGEVLSLLIGDPRLLVAADLVTAFDGVLMLVMPPINVRTSLPEVADATALPRAPGLWPANRQAELRTLLRRRFR